MNWNLIGRELIRFAASFWGVLGEMSPYLLFGFLVAGLLSVLIKPRTVERHLGGGGFWSIFKASAFGVPLPLCSCGVIPVAASLRRHGASRGATTSFLLSTPQTGIDSIFVTYSLLGPVFAVYRPIAAFVMGLVGGTLVSAFGDGKSGENGEADAPPACTDACCAGERRRGRLAEALHYGFGTLPQDIAKPLLFGVFIAALITVAVPKGYFEQYVGGGIGGMLIMMAFGIPLYVCATASVPIAVGLIHAGVSPGAALVFLVTGPATNAATISTIWKVMGPRTAVIYLITVAVSSVASGLALDGLIARMHVPMLTHPDMGTGLFGSVAAVALIALLAWSIYRARRSGTVCETEMSGVPDKIELSIQGMHCSHCAAAIERALGECEGVESAKVDLVGGRAAVTGRKLDTHNLKDAVTRLGYTVKGGDCCGDRCDGHGH